MSNDVGIVWLFISLMFFFLGVYVGVRITKNGEGLKTEEEDNKQMDAEEVINGLQNLRMSLSWHEKEYLDYACGCVYKVDVLTKFIEQYEGNNPK